MHSVVLLFFNNYLLNCLQIAETKTPIAETILLSISKTLIAETNAPIPYCCSDQKCNNKKDWNTVSINEVSYMDENQLLKSNLCKIICCFFLTMS